MIQTNYRARFLLKPLQPVGISRKTKRQKFERGLATCGYVSGQIDFAHPTAADPFRNFVVADRMADERISLPILNNPRRETDS